MALIADLLIAAALLAAVVIGARRGLLRSLTGLVVVVLAFVLASWAADRLADPVAQKLSPIGLRHHIDELFIGHSRDHQPHIHPGVRRDAQRLLDGFLHGVIRRGDIQHPLGRGDQLQIGGFRRVIRVIQRAVLKGLAEALRRRAVIHALPRKLFIGNAGELRNERRQGPPLRQTNQRVEITALPLLLQGHSADLNNAVTVKFNARGLRVKDHHAVKLVPQLHHAAQFSPVA